MQRLAPLALFAALCLPLAGCDGVALQLGNATPTTTAVSATRTATRTAVATATPTARPAAAVAGLALLSAEVVAGAEDALAPAPAEWNGTALAPSFPRAFSHADWLLRGPEGRSGATGADGSFAIPDLAPGTYELELRKSLNGNLVSVVVPLTVGDDGGAAILVEIDQGRVRASTSYGAEGAAVHEVAGPDASRVVIADGRIVDLIGAGRHLTDPDGDGRFDIIGCAAGSLWRCDAAGAACDDDRRCQCTASCPFCEDCGPPVCTPPLPYNPYRCDPAGACAQPGDVCTCVPSCPDCDDCALSVCVPGCEPVAIEALRITGSGEVVAGRRGHLAAVAELDNGATLDVTYLVDWRSDDPAVATVDAWGFVTGVAPGSTSVSATFNGIEATPFRIRVVEQPAVTQVEVHVRDCIVPYGMPRDPAASLPALPDGFIPYPVCRDVVRVGSTAYLVAFVHYADGSLDIVSDGAAWAVTPAAVATIDAGVLTALAAGTARVTATVGGVTSAPRELRVVAEASVEQLMIHPNYMVDGPIFFPALADDPAWQMPPAECFDCGWDLTLLAGDARPFHATARYDTGEWEEVTDRVAWSSSDPAVAAIDAGGVLTAAAAGETVVSASLGEVRSNDVPVRVVAEATVTEVYIYQDGSDRVVARGGEAWFRAQAAYDVGFTRDVTDAVTWRTADAAVGTFTAPGVFTGAAAGATEVWAELDGLTSSRLPIGVFETSDITYCDPNDVNRGSWSDAFNRVILESDCRTYTPPDVAELRFTVTERERPFGIFDPCLDLYVYQGERKVRTIREQGCGEPFLAPGSPAMEDAAPRYQLKAFWDLKDDAGNAVAPGVYTIHGRFYLYYDPVVSIDVAVAAADGLIPCTPNACGNGCGWVGACGEIEPPAICPDICTPTCECPAGWGITPEGGCEPCEVRCCPPNARCTADVPPCEPEPQCCRPGETCIDILPPCAEEPRCCPAGEVCFDLPPCEADCCPAGAPCRPGMRICEQAAPTCVVTGCSGQICAPHDVASTCEFLPEYACYADAACEAQADGGCAWTQTEALQRCLAGSRER